jgi:hypothetical protein
VNGVIEINVVRNLVDLDPFHRIARLVAGAHRREQRAVGLDLVVAVHARLRGRHGGRRALVHADMAVTAIDAELAVMQRMAERHRLDGRVANARVFRRGVIGGGRGDDANQHQDENDDLERQFVGRLREDMRHKPWGR